MKKYTVLAAAIAMIAFAGCNKEENNRYVADENGNICLNFSKENCQNADKQTYNADLNMIYFDGDAMMINGNYHETTLINAAGNLIEPGIGVMSDYARVYINEAEWADGITFLYPYEAFNFDETFDIADGLTMVPENAGTIDQITAGDVPWPMGYRCDNIADAPGHFQLKNAFAIVSPAIKYGVNFMNDLRNCNSYFSGYPAFATTADLPDMFITGVELTASNYPMFGTAEMNFTNGIPVQHITDALDAGVNNTIHVDCREAQQIQKGGSNWTIVGNIPVDPSMNEGTINIDLFFDLVFADATYHCVYHGTPAPLAVNFFMRSMRTQFSINMFNPLPGAAAKVTVLSVE